MLNRTIRFQGWDSERRFKPTREKGKNCGCLPKQSEANGDEARVVFREIKKNSATVENFGRALGSGCIQEESPPRRVKKGPKGGDSGRVSGKTINQWFLLSGNLDIHPPDQLIPKNIRFKMMMETISCSVREWRIEWICCWYWKPIPISMPLTSNWRQKSPRWFIYWYYCSLNWNE